MRLPVDLGLSFSEETTRTQRDGSFTIRYWMDAEGFAKPTAVRTVLGVPANGAVWFLASLEDMEEGGDPSRSDAEGALDEDVPELVRERVSLALSEFPEIDSGMALNLHQGFLDKVVARFNALTQEERTIRVELTSYEGYLKESYKEVGLVGRGGYSVRFAKKGSAYAAAAVSPVSSEWVEGRGMKLSGRLGVRAEGVVRLHVDPFVGSGMGTDIKLAASTVVPLSVDLDARLIDNSEGVAAMMGPAIRCERFRIKLEEKKVDILGIEMDEFVGKTQPEPWLIMGSQTHWTRLAEKRAGGELTLDEDLWIGLRTNPTAVVAGSNGYKILADIESELSIGKPDGSATATEQTDQFAAAWRRAVQRQCPEERDVVFLFAGHDFGHNNEIVKAMKLLVKAVDQSTDLLEVSWEQLTTVIRDPSKAPEVAGEILVKLGREAENFIKDLGDKLGF